MYVRATIFFAVMPIASAAWASDAPLYQPAPGWIVPAPPIDTAKAPADGSALLMFDQQLRLADGGRWIYVESAMRAVSAEMLGQMGTITLPWHPAKGDLIIHRAEILRAGETVDLIGKGAKFTVLQREQQLERQTLTGILSATMAIEGLRVGDIVRLSFSVTQKDPVLDGRMEASTMLLADPVRVQFGRVRMIWPTSSKMAFKAFGALPEVKPVRNGAYQEIAIALPLAKQPEMPADAPPRFARPPILEASSFANWEDVSKTAAPLYRTDGLIAPGTPLAGEVAKIAAAQSDPRQRAAAALRLVQDQVRYLFRGMDQGNYVPQTPVQTWDLRYGDCKAKTLLLLAILRALDIRAEPVLANLGLGDWIPDRLPSFGAFDHVLVRAEIDGKTLWLDGTGSGSRFEDLDDTPPLRMVLPLRAEGAALLPVPTRSKARADVLVDLELDQSAGISFPPPFKLSMMVRGPVADMLRMTSAQAGAKGLKDAVTGLVSGYVNGGAVVTRSVTFDEAGGGAKVEATGLANLNWRKEDERYQIVLDKAVGAISFEPDRNRPAWRTVPVVVPQFPSQLIRTRLRLPGGGKGFELQGDAKLSEMLAGIELGRTSGLDADWVTVEERIAPRDTEVAADAVPAMRERVAQAQTRLFKVVAPQGYPARWQQVEGAKAMKRLDPILALYQKAIDDDPDEATGYRNRAIFLAAIYERRRAIADIDQIIKREPDAAIHAWRARLLTDLGEKDKALADLETARKLDPASAEVVGQLASLLQDSGRGDAAIRLVDERISVGGSDKRNFMALKADLLGKLGRVDEAMQIYDTAIAASPGSPDLLNGRCWLKGTRNVMLDTALKDCTKAIELMESPAAALDSRAMVYFRMGRLDDALADLDAAYMIDQQIPAVMFMRGIIRARGGDSSAARSDLAAARLLSPRIDEIYAEYGIKP